MTEISDLKQEVGKLCGIVETEGRATRDSIGHLFTLGNSNADRLTKIESGACPGKRELEDKIASHTHQPVGGTIVVKKPMSPKQLITLIACSVAGIGIGIVLIVRFVSGA